MNSRIFLLFSAVIGLFSSAALGAWQPAPTVTRDDQGFPRLSWLSLPGRTYFVQYSYDLEDWTYTSEIFHEGFGVVGMTFDSGDDTIYLRLKYTDIPTYDAELANFDGAGGTNQQELDAGSDPLVAEAGEEEVPVPGENSPAPPPLIPGVDDDDVEAAANSHPVYFIRMVETGGASNGTRYYFLNRHYQLLPGFTLLGGDSGEDSWPASISRKPVGVKTKITFELVSGEGSPAIFAKHERPIDLLLYESNEQPGYDVPDIRSVTNVGTFIIPRMGTSSEAATITGDNDENDPDGNYWGVSPFVVRGLEPDPDADPDASPGDQLIYSRRAGTDIVSRRSLPAVFDKDGALEEGDLGHLPFTAIMAPDGGGSTHVEIEANVPFPIVLEDGGGVISPSVISGEAGSIGYIPEGIRGQVTADAGDEMTLGLLNVRPHNPGGDPSAPNIVTTLPVAIVSIPTQTVTVNIYPISSITDGFDSSGNAIVVRIPPNPLPSEEQIQDYFDRVFFKQSNVKCQITLHPIDHVRWDVAKGKVDEAADAPFPNTYFHYFAPETDVSTPGDRILDFHTSDLEKGPIVAVRALPLTELHLFLVGGAEVARDLVSDDRANVTEEIEGRWRGYANIEEQICWVIGDATKALGKGDLATKKYVVNKLLHTMAHEIGHVLIGEGHPDQNGGPAPLANDPALQQRRLMVSREAPVSDYELVKVEWEEIFFAASEISNRNSEDE